VAQLIASTRNGATDVPRNPVASGIAGLKCLPSVISKQTWSSRLGIGRRADVSW